MIRLKKQISAHFAWMRSFSNWLEWKDILQGALKIQICKLKSQKNDCLSQLILITTKCEITPWIGFSRIRNWHHLFSASMLQKMKNVQDVTKQVNNFLPKLKSDVVFRHRRVMKRNAAIFQILRRILFNIVDKIFYIIFGK